MVNPWIETVSVLALAAAGVAFGRYGRRSRRCRLVGYIMPPMLLVLLLAGRTAALSDVMPWLDGLAWSRWRYAALAVVISVGLTTPLPQLAYRFEKALTCLLMALFLGRFAVTPIMSAAVVQGELAATTTRTDAQGVCRQSRDYTCLPAAAVTALNRLGLAADEGELAVLSRSSPATGTLPLNLCQAVSSRFAKQNVYCRWTRLDSVEDVPAGAILLAQVRDSSLSDHCVAVLAADERGVTLADPARGTVVMSHSEFLGVWRHCGIVIARTAPRDV